jgi:hypothetical protein
MSGSRNEKAFETSCEILGKTHSVVTNFPSEKFVINHIFAITFNGVLIVPTILLNAAAIITIWKSSQLKSKPCYFIILVQSAVDLSVGVFGIPLFLVFLSSAVGGMTNCLAVTLAFRSATLPIGISTITLSALILERYIAILHPYAYETQVTKKRLVIYLGSGIVVATCILVIALRNPRLYGFSVGALEMSIFVFTAFSYRKIYLVVKKLRHSTRKPHDAAATVENMTKLKLFLREFKQAKSCFMVVICFAVFCFVPTAIALAIYTSVDKFEWLAIIAWGYTLVQVNSSVNSVIFFWTKTMLRNEAVKMLNTACFS